MFRTRRVDFVGGPGNSNYASNRPASTKLHVESLFTNMRQSKVLTVNSEYTLYSNVSKSWKQKKNHQSA